MTRHRPNHPAKPTGPPPHAAKPPEPALPIRKPAAPSASAAQRSIPAALPVVANAGADGPVVSPSAPLPQPSPVADVQTSVSLMARAAEMQWRIYQANNEWIRFADLKAGALLTANGALLAAALSALKDNGRFLRTHHGVLGFALLSGAALLVSFGYSLWCISPKTARFHARHDRHTDSLLFFEHIAAIGKDTYLDKAKDLGSDESAYHQIAQQVWINSRVSQKKHRQITLAVRAFALSIVSALIAALLAWRR